MPVVRELITRLGYRIQAGDLRRYAAQLGGVLRTITRIGLAATATAGGLALIGGGAFLRRLVTTNQTFEGLRASLETATGSVREAEEAFAFLERFAATTPFQLEEVVQAFITLQNRGIEPTEELLLSLGNTAAAQNKPLAQFIEAVADASVGEFERLLEFGIKARKEGENVTFTFRGQSKTIRNDAATITAFLKDLGETEFAGGLARQINTIGGQLSNLRDNFNAFLRAVGGAGFNDAFRRLLFFINRNRGEIGELATVIGRGLAVSLERIIDILEFFEDPPPGLVRLRNVLLSIIIPGRQALLVLQDLVVFLRGGESLIGELLGEEDSARIRAFLRVLVAQVIPAVSTFLALLPTLSRTFDEAFRELRPAFVELFNAFRELAAAFAGTEAEELDFVQTAVILIRVLRDLIVFFARVARVVLEVQASFIRAIATILRFSQQVRGGAVVALRLLEMAIANVREAFLIANLNVQTGLLGIRTILALLTGDFNTATAQWSAALQTVSQSLDLIGGRFERFNIDTAIGRGPPPPGALPAATGGGAGGGRTENRNTLSVGAVNVTIPGGSNIGPDQAAESTRSGVGQGLRDLLGDITRNTDGSVQ